MLYCTEYMSPLGKLTAAGSLNGLAGLWFEGQKYYMNKISEVLPRYDDLEIFKDMRKWLDDYFSGKKPLPSDICLTPDGSEFQKSVWRLMCDIPYGETTTYGKIADKMGRKTMSAQAVGGAVAHNPISIIIPCHRVVGANGKLTGYAGGLDRKIKLLSHEGVF